MTKVKAQLRTNLTKSGTVWKCEGKENFNDSADIFSRPTHQLLARWLREKHKLFIEVTVDFKNADYANNKEEFHSYEKVMEDGLQEALKLI